MLLGRFSSPDLTLGGRVVEARADVGGVRGRVELVPRWVTVDEALAANRAVQAGGVGVMRWLVRETAVLEWLAAQVT
ncbi:hypothetical protein ACWCOV_10955 [Kribbella sp. NPDC002412]